MCCIEKIIQMKLLSRMPAKDVRFWHSRKLSDLMGVCKYSLLGHMPSASGVEETKDLNDASHPADMAHSLNFPGHACSSQHTEAIFDRMCKHS